MTTKQTLLALAERVEKLTGLDREVDAEIYLALHKPDWRDGEPWKRTNGWFKPNCADDAMAYFFHDGMGQAHKAAPRFTESLDAAMTLLDPDWHCGIGRDGSRDRPTSSWAWVRYPDKDSTWSMTETCMIFCEGQPALALTASSLRAKAEMMG